jgi:hypothetical protein
MEQSGTSHDRKAVDNCTLFASTEWDGIEATYMASRNDAVTPQANGKQIATSRIYVSHPWAGDRISQRSSKTAEDE